MPSYLTKEDFDPTTMKHILKNVWICYTSDKLLYNQMFMTPAFDKKYIYYSRVPILII